MIGQVLNPIFREIVYPLIYVLFAVAVFFFAFGVIKMILKGDEEARSTGRRHILFGVIGMFIMISAWGIVRFVSDTLKSLGTEGETSSSNEQEIDPAGELKL